MANTQEKEISKTLDEIIKEADRIEECAQLTGKGHFVSSHYWKRLHYIIGVPLFIMASVLGTTAFSSLDVQGKWASILAVSVAVLSALMTFLNPNEKATNHLNAGNSYNALENDVRIFRTIECWKNEPIEILSERIKNFSKYKDQLNASSPQVPWFCYILAKIGIWMGEANFKIDEKK